MLFVNFDRKIIKLDHSAHDYANLLFILKHIKFS